MLSIAYRLGKVQFPSFREEQVKMQPFTLKEGLPLNLKERWQATVDSMLSGFLLDAQTTIYLMVDQSSVKAGNTQRRPGVHVDRIWDPTLGWCGSGGGWCGRGYQTLVLASDVQGCAVYEGQYDEPSDEYGGYAHLNLNSLKRTEMVAGRVYAGDTTQLLHEPLPMPFDVNRTLVRLHINANVLD